MAEETAEVKITPPDDKEDTATAPAENTAEETTADNDNGAAAAPPDDTETVEKLRTELVERINEKVAGWKEDEKQSKEVDAFLTTPNLRRFLVARDHHYPKAFKMASDALEWRCKVCPLSLTVADFATANEQGVWRPMGYAKNGWPILLIRARLWAPWQYSVDEYVRMVSYYMERNIQRMRDPEKDRNFLLFDMQGMSYMSSDIRKVSALAKMTSDYFAERLGLAFCVNADMLTMTLWNLVQTIIDKRTAAKARIFRTNYTETLDELIGLDQCWTDLTGGTRTEDWPIERQEEATTTPSSENPTGTNPPSNDEKTSSDSPAAGSPE